MINCPQFSETQNIFKDKMDKIVELKQIDALLSPLLNPLEGSTM